MLANVLLIPLFGVMAAAITTLLSFALLVSLAYYFSQEMYPLSYDWRRVLLLVGVALLLYLFTRLFSFESVFISLAFNTLVAISYPAVLWAAGFFEASEIESMKEQVARIRTRFGV